MSNTVNVERLKGGAWAVTSSQGTQNPLATFKSKADAVTKARSIAPAGKIVIHTSTGQILRPPLVKPSKAPSIMRAAVLSVVQGGPSKQKGRAKK
jgi:hypothetical protein